MANAEAQTATRKLFGSFLQNRPHQEAVTPSLQELAEGYEKPVTAGMLRLYTAALAEFSREEIVLAFNRATEGCKFFPSPATLREFSGRAVTGDPLAAEAKAELLKRSPAIQCRRILSAGLARVLRELPVSTALTPAA